MVLKKGAKRFTQTRRSELFSDDREYFELPMNLEPVLQIHV